MSGVPEGVREWTPDSAMSGERRFATSHWRRPLDHVPLAESAVRNFRYLVRMASSWPYYSDRSGLRAPSSGLVREDIPQGVRNALTSYLKARNAQSVSSLWKSIVAALDWDPDLTTREGYSANVRVFHRTIAGSSWVQFLDLVGAIHEWVAQGHITGLFTASDFRNFLNGRLLRHYSAYRLSDEGLVEEPGASVTEEAVAEARALLRDGAFAGPDRQFQGALEDFYRAPTPDHEGAVVGAIGAVEGVARIVLDDKNVVLSDAMKHIRETNSLHPALADSIVKLYGYASDAGGRHGLVGDPDVDRPIAEFCLHQCAAAIVFMARLYGHDVVEESSGNT